jgi:hypothetical protein
MTEDGEPCDGFPNLNYLLGTFGRLDERVLKPHELPTGYRDMAGKWPEIPGVKWVPRPYYPRLEPEQPWVPMAMRPGPEQIAYTICYGGRHFQIEERLVNGERQPKLLKTESCLSHGTYHLEPSRVRVAMEMMDLPPATRDLIAPSAWKQSSLSFKRIWARLFRTSTAS